MKHNCRIFGLLIPAAALILCFSAAVHGQAVTGPERPPIWLSPTALVATPDAETLYVACATAGRVLAVDLRSRRVVQSIVAPASPLGLALSRDGARLYVACAAPLSTICVVDTAKNAIVQRISTGHTTMAPVLSPDGKVLFACNRFQDDVIAIDLVTGEAIWRERVRREPIAAAVTPDGNLLLVANHLHSGRSDGGVIGAVVSVLDTANGCTRKQIQLPRGSGLVRDIAVSPDGRFAAVTHLVARYYLPPVQVSSGGINANALSLLDVKPGVDPGRLSRSRRARCSKSMGGRVEP
jgi:DNA-binding beta-propeller fold protein YncE